MTEKKGAKDHYVPKFYLKRWSQNNPGKRLFSAKFIPYDKRLHWTEHAPAGIGYERDLYGEIEESFFKPLDDDASKILNKIESEGAVTPIKIDLGESAHNSWAKFIIGFMIRTPIKIKSIQKSFGDAGFAESIARKQIPKIARSERAIRDLRAFTWVFARVNTNLELITCDNPLIFKPNNLSHPECVIVLPMSPKHFFLATNKRNLAYLEQNPRKMVININKEIISNAREQIYVRSRHSVADAFVVKHWISK